MSYIAKRLVLDDFPHPETSRNEVKIDMIDKAIIKELSEIVGKENVAEDRETRICYAYDATNIHHLPDLVVFPRTTQHISGVLKLANEHQLPGCPARRRNRFTGSYTLRLLEFIIKRVRS